MRESSKEKIISLIITVLVVTVTIAMGLINGPEKAKTKNVDKVEKSVAANSGNERADIGKIGNGEYKYKESPSSEYITKYNKWLYEYAGTTAGKNVGAGQWRTSGIKKAAWCYIFVDWCVALLWNSAFRCLNLSFSPLLFASLLFTAIFKYNHILLGVRTSTNDF